VKDATSAPSPALDAPVLIGVAPALPAAVAEADGADLPATLPRDHPAWQRDVLSVSARARGVLAHLRPVVVRVLTFWDHVVRSAGIGGNRRVEVDPSGCYRLR
jgi:hypothetical protein